MVSDLAGLELWRGGVNTWECDEMGHLNVRFYVARAMEGLTGLASALGLAGAFRSHADTTLQVREQHIRFLREARPRAALHMVGGLIEIGECEARLFQMLVHSNSGEPAASFQTTVVHVTARDTRPFAWSDRTRALAEGLRMEPPAGTGPRSLDLAPSQSLASLAEDLGYWGRAIADPTEALSIVRRNARSDDIVVVTGSTFVVAQVREWWLEHVATPAAGR